MTEAKNDFLSAVDTWLCDDYMLDIRYFARPSPNGLMIMSAAITMNPLKASIDNSFSISTGNIITGQIQRYPVNKVELDCILSEATEGRISLPHATIQLAGSLPFDYYSEMAKRERWFSELHLQIGGDRSPKPSPESLSKIDNDLRASSPPFDGLTDLTGWMGLDSAALNGGAPTISIRVGPPVDLIFDKCELRDNKLSLVLHAHRAFDLARASLAVRGVPGGGLTGRQQVAKKISWSEVKDDKLEGTTHIEMRDCDSALAMLMIGASTVRRQWFLDPAKARNHRFMAVQHFDTDLRKIRNATLESSDSAKFEQRVAALLFLLGFSPIMQLETDSPDLIVTSPGGQLVIVECTTKISDFSAKLGKLVDRRGSLSKSLAGAGHPPEILAVLICRTPRDQIAAHEEELRTHKVLLLTREDLDSSFDRVRHPGDPDKIIDDAKARLESQTKDLFNT
jgi:hypothetical protein